MPVQDYTHMTRFFAVLTIFLIVAALVGAAYVLLRRVHQQDSNLARMARRQNDAISQVIIELRSAPGLYGGFPQALSDRLFRLHEDYSVDILGKGRDEIED